ncbi:hypothetical protein K435DRAFT_424475 [Dendrothele bispora CBS 962.96]|uniref:Uncharacterized protein n=1 Tax=Dendrothele bispora (strain CBS 962.96) TaxID=1314807 RepID=A0A4S8L5J8_DENBC|nr:hypothetical protein K435DRAFT_424475 [Dendrothele bispora CBS 962.96]
MMESLELLCCTGRRNYRCSATVIRSVCRPESTYSTYSVGSTRPHSVMNTLVSVKNGRSYEGHGSDCCSSTVMSSARLLANRIELDPRLRCRVLNSNFVHICPSLVFPKDSRYFLSLPDPSALQIPKWTCIRN